MSASKQKHERKEDEEDKEEGNEEEEEEEDEEDDEEGQEDIAGQDQTSFAELSPELSAAKLAKDGFVFRALGPELMTADAWDDTALIKAWDNAIQNYQSSHDPAKSDSVVQGSNKRKGKANEVNHSAVSGSSSNRTVSNDHHKQKHQSDDKASATIKSPAKTAKATKPTEQSWQVGDECLAPFSEDGLLYVAVIDRLYEKVSKKSGASKMIASVTFTDYGNSENVPVSQLCPVGSHDANEDQQEEQPKPKPVNSSKKAAKAQQPPIPQPQPQHHPASYAPYYPWAAAPPPPATYAYPTHPEYPPSLPLPDDEDLANLLMAWYFSGYYTGLYQAKQSQHRRY